MGEYVKDEWGKKGTYYVPPKNPPKEEVHYYAPGDDYDRLERNNAYINEVLAKKTAGSQKYWKKNKPKTKPKRNWGVRIVLFMLMMLAMAFSWKTAESNSQVVNFSKGNQSDAGAKLNYHVKNVQFITEQSDTAESAIREFCSIYGIEYSTLNYDYDVKGYVLETKNMGIYLTEDAVKAKGQSLQKDFETYCMTKGSNFDIQMVTVIYEYTQVRY